MLCDLQIFSGKVYQPEPPHAQSLFLFPIVFGIVNKLMFFHFDSPFSVGDTSNENPTLAGYLNVFDNDCDENIPEGFTSVPAAMESSLPTQPQSDLPRWPLSLLQADESDNCTVAADQNST